MSILRKNILNSVYIMGRLVSIVRQTFEILFTLCVESPLILYFIWLLSLSERRMGNLSISQYLDIFGVPQSSGDAVHRTPPRVALLYRRSDIFSFFVLLS